MSLFAIYATIEGCSTKSACNFLQAWTAFTSSALFTQHSFLVIRYSSKAVWWQPLAVCKNDIQVHRTHPVNSQREPASWAWQAEQPIAVSGFPARLLPDSHSQWTTIVGAFQQLWSVTEFMCKPAPTRRSLVTDWQTMADAGVCHLVELRCFWTRSNSYRWIQLYFVTRLVFHTPYTWSYVSNVHISLWQCCQSSTPNTACGTEH